MKDDQNHRLSLAATRDGKLGLALSGGGFRAALFHVGVLARLAERDLLRHVSVISTVSGGAIIGAFYYLKVQQLLAGAREDGLTPSAAAYRQLVSEVEREFLSALQLNLRIMAFADRQQNARIMAGEYSASERFADLFDAHFFQPITGTERTLLRDLPIQAGDSPEAVVPTLILNATALNTGHLFQMTGRFVGEPSISSVAGGTTAMPQLPRLFMDDPGLSTSQRSRLQHLTLGQAVAASCCVPGLFEPFSLRGLYEGEHGEEVVVRLVDGGVFDNQALVSLFEEECTHFVCSDASELLQYQSQPVELIHQVAMRANDIMMDRIRNEIMAELRERRAGRYALFTLGDEDGNTRFGEDSARLLQALRDIRTDLDAFTDLEACALMYHGFMLSGFHLQGEGPDGAPEAGGDPWRFTRIEALADDPRQRARLLRHLAVGSRQFLKVFYLGKPLPWLIMVVPSTIPVGSAVLLIYLLPPIPTAAWVVLGLLALTAVAFVQNARIIEWLDQMEWARKSRRKLAAALRPIGTTMVLGGIGALASWINLRIFNRLFLRYGRLRDTD